LFYLFAKSYIFGDKAPALDNSLGWSISKKYGLTDGPSDYLVANWVNHHTLGVQIVKVKSSWWNLNILSKIKPRFVALVSFKM